MATAMKLRAMPPSGNRSRDAARATLADGYAPEPIPLGGMARTARC